MVMPAICIDAACASASCLGQAYIASAICENSKATMRLPTIRRLHCVTMRRMETMVGCSLCWTCGNLTRIRELSRERSAAMAHLPATAQSPCMEGHRGPGFISPESNLSACLVPGQSENASAYSAIRLTMGTIISRPSQPEKPALAKIFQNGSTITTAPSNIVSQWAPNHHAMSFIYIPFIMIGNLSLIVSIRVSLVRAAAAAR